MQNENTRNTILFVVCSAVLLLAYQMFVLAPNAHRRQQAAAVQASQTAAQKPGGEAGAPPAVTRGQAMAQAPRMPIDTPALKGSVSLTGGKIDDLFLKDYRQTPDPKSPFVELFRPEGAPGAYFAQTGWIGAGMGDLPNDATPWSRISGDVLSPGHPIVLQFTHVSGLVFRRTLTVDARYMFTVTDTATNTGGRPIQIKPYATVQREGLPADAKAQAFQGAVGVFDGKLKLEKYGDLKKKGGLELGATGGWMGLTDKYWLAALIPSKGEAVRGQYRMTSLDGADIYAANFTGQPRTVQPGATVTETTRIFAGAKRAEVLRDYQKAQGIPRFDDAIDWGFLFPFTRFFFWVLETFFHLAKNFGLAILALTVVVRLVLFPLANQSYASMTKMKKLQPKIEEIKAKAAGDTAKQQQETMALYQREKINPLAGCLPLLLQIPVFLSLVKVLYVTIEARHAPFYGWINDLSARDPTTFVNLFGLLPFDPAHVPMIGVYLDGFAHIGAWPLLYGLTMWLQTSMSPQAADPTQQAMFKWFPVVFTVMLAQTPVGLVIYWCWSNLLTVLQQYIMMKRHHAENPIDDFIGRVRERLGGSRAAAGT